MSNETIRKIMLNIPYAVSWYVMDKVSCLYRSVPTDVSGERILYVLMNTGEAFDSALPSVNGYDILAGLTAAAVLRAVVYAKGKNRKQFRQGIEYGSARWGTAKDIKPYIDDDPDNNILLTATESLTMNSRPKNPKYARNKNVVVIGGSGSGKTRFFVKPQLMQMHSSYVVTDPKGYNNVGHRKYHTNTR
jgi:type IV secretion system protein VirD4